MFIGVRSLYTAGQIIALEWLPKSPSDDLCLPIASLPGWAPGWLMPATVEYPLESSLGLPIWFWRDCIEGRDEAGNPCCWQLSEQPAESPRYPLRISAYEDGQERDHIITVSD